MTLTFTPVVPGYNNGTYEFDTEFVKEFMEAWNYFTEYPDHRLSTNFSTASEREAWLKKAQAYGLSKPKGEQIVVRRIKRTGSSDPSTGKLTFVMEAKSVADARRAKLREEAAVRKQRKQINDVAFRSVPHHINQPGMERDH